MTEESSPQLKARIAGIFYLLTFVSGILALASANGRFAANLVSTGSYLVVTILFYGLFKPVSRAVSLLAAIISLVGLTVGTLLMFRVITLAISNLVFFGFYCLLIGWLVFRSTFLPRVLGVLMMIGGLGWLTFMSPALSKSLSPYNMAPGIIAEGVLTLWLLAFGVNAQRWREQAAGAKHAPTA